ncbi:MAG: tetratricopeptide repeat protein [Verrucomicrobiota bacterium]
MAKKRGDAPAPDPIPQEAARKSRGAAFAIVIVALLLVGTFGWWKIAHRDRSPAASPIQGAAQSSPAPASTSKPTPAPSLPPLLEPEAQVFARYAGSQACRECHPAQFEPWAKSNHGNAERLPDKVMDAAAFSPERTFHHGTQDSVATLKDGKPVVKTLGFGGAHERYPITRVIGHDPLRQYLVERPGGRVQTLEVAFDPKRNQWFDVYGDEDRKPGEWGHWTGRGMGWNAMCASCHNTRLRKNYDAASDTYRTTMAEMSVGCESCHGPMKAHMEWRKQYPGSKEPDPTVKKLTRDQVFDTCGSCHARRRELTGDFVPGDSFAQHFQLTTVDESDLYFPDGQIRDELYEYGSFHGSKMHTAGVRCADCHDPHAAKPRVMGNALCLRCHTGAPGQIPDSTVIAPIIDPGAHSFHKADSTGAQCVNCHMPVTTYMQRHPRHDHGFTIPDPLLTKEHRVPNACNKCHTDKDTDWALSATEKWWGDKMKRPSRERAQTVAAARAGTLTSGVPLLTLLRNEPNGYWKASLIRLLGAWSADAEVARAFLEYAQHPDPLVRTAAVQALESVGGPLGDAAQKVLARRTEDNERAVRIAAVSALRAVPDARSRAFRELMHALDLAADQPMGQLQKGAWAQAHGDAAGALAHFEKAVAWDPNSGGIRNEFARLLSGMGRAEDTLVQMQEAVRLEPKQAEFRFNLALAWNESGDMRNAVREFEEAVKIDPRHARAWYNLGLAHSALGKAAEAVTALRKGEDAEPRDARIPYARATIHARLGQRAAAREAALRALTIQPDYQDAQQLLRQLGQ